MMQLITVCNLERMITIGTSPCSISTNVDYGLHYVSLQRFHQLCHLNTNFVASSKNDHHSKTIYKNQTLFREENLIMQTYQSL